MRRSSTLTMALSAMFLALGMIMPFLTAQIPEIGSKLLPMHIPVLLCGFVCGWQYGLVVGFITPLLRSMIFSTPPMFPIAVSMAFELAAYGFVTGFLYPRLKKNVAMNYVTLIVAMICGRLIWGLVRMVLLGIRGTAFNFTIFMTGAFTNAFPGIIIQLILIPLLLKILNKTNVLENLNHGLQRESAKSKTKSSI